MAQRRRPTCSPEFKRRVVRREVTQLRQERDILRKATAFFDKYGEVCGADITACARRATAGSISR